MTDSVLNRWQLQCSYAHLPERLYTPMGATDFPQPRLLALNHGLADTLGLSELFALAGDSAVASTLCGATLLEGAKPLAQAYAGHQFGYFNILGDGRAMLLGEVVAPCGVRYDIHLKGAGRTAYARGGDGRATLPAMLREYLISEAMHALGIATSRSLAVVTTGEYVQREVLLPGAVLARVARSHLRVGTFEFASYAGYEELLHLADYTIARHYPQLQGEAEASGVGVYRLLLKSVVKAQAKLVAQWQLVGFIHGVMNTDNLTISGETLDYGPCAFVDAYDPRQVFSSIDTHGRYRYEAQPDMALWGVSRLAEALLPLLHAEQEQAIEVAMQTLAEFEPTYTQAWRSGMRAKLGLCAQTSEEEALFAELLGLMQAYGADYTNTFARLTLERSGEDGGYLQGTQSLFEGDRFAQWRASWAMMLERQGISAGESAALMRGANPFVIPRNHRVEEVLASAVAGDMAPLRDWLEVLASPYRYTQEHRAYQALPEMDMAHYRTYCGT